MGVILALEKDFGDAAAVATSPITSLIPRLDRGIEVPRYERHERSVSTVLSLLETGLSHRSIRP